MESFLKSIAFDGIHRCGKGTQIELIKSMLENRGYRVIVIRGEGSREGRDGSELYFDPTSTYFQQFNREKIQSSKMKWAEASDRIQRELLYWNRKLSGSLEAEKTIVLLDRSLFSRFILFRQIDPTVSLNSLMRTSEGRKILLPNILFIFSVEMEQLFSRISTTDPKGAFRRRNIQESMPIFEKIIHELPLAIKERTKIIMCAEDNPHQIATRVYSCISSLIPLS